MLYPDFNELVALKNQLSRLRFNSNRAVKSSVPGDHHSPFRGQGLEFDTVREYVPGDDIRNIDWRVTARKGSPHLKLFREERERQVIVCVDMNESMRFGTRNTFKSVQAARAASLLGWRSLSSHDRVGAYLFGDVPNGSQYFAPQRTRKSLWAMLKLLSNPPSVHHQVTLEETVQHINKAAHTGSLIYLISDFMDLTGQLERRLSKLNKRCDVVFIAINDPSDKSISPISALAIQGINSEKICVNTESLAGRKAYTTQWQENRLRLHEITRTLKIATIELTTEMNMNRDLMYGLKMISRRKKR